MFILKLSGIQMLFCSRKYWGEMFVLKISGTQNTLSNKKTEIKLFV